ncbi:MAG: putative eukaryotic initiation factor 4A-III [Streblomastix strix]|uniref:Putative eukaryotic initiation factor 4A-III n=1 Tax=Streblomastix strix TaxID=222440 RepID=A0A5J4TA60_9EUKA|nr:MAG: putative eukaryotic initiation factor 4A-III [Streblomastix strix]
MAQPEKSTKVEITGDDVQQFKTFEEMKLKDEVLRGIYNYGFEKPSLIQQKGIVPIIRGRDLVAQAQSGTGKTATFCIALLQMIDLTLNRTQEQYRMKKFAVSSKSGSTYMCMVPLIIGKCTN